MYIIFILADSPGSSMVPNFFQYDFIARAVVVVVVFVLFYFILFCLFHFFVCNQIMLKQHDYVKNYVGFSKSIKSAALVQMLI